MTESGESLLVGAVYSLDVNNQTPGYGPGDVYWPWEAAARSGPKGRKRVARIGVKVELAARDASLARTAEARRPPLTRRRSHESPLL